MFFVCVCSRQDERACAVCVCLRVHLYRLISINVVVCIGRRNLPPPDAREGTLLEFIDYTRLYVGAVTVVSTSGAVAAIGHLALCPTISDCLFICQSGARQFITAMQSPTQQVVPILSSPVLDTQKPVH